MQPRPQFATAEPTLCNDLALIFTKAKDKVATGLERRKVTTQSEQQFAQRFKGYKLPPTLAALCRGEIPERPDLGFQQLAMQIAITAHACGTSESDLIEICRPLIKNHVGNGSRYNTPHQREAELRRMYRYMQENPCYRAGASFIRSVLPPRTQCRDLRGLA